MNYVIVRIGGKQYKVIQGDILEVEKLAGEKGKVLTFENILLLVNEEKVKIGQPKVSGAKIKAEILDQIKGEKIRVATYKAKSRYRRVKGFRPQLTRIKIKSIAP